MILAHKIALDPNNVQETYFRKAAGTARFAYNWALAEWQRQYEAWKADPTGLKPSDPALRKQLNVRRPVSLDAGGYQERPTDGHQELGPSV